MLVEVFLLLVFAILFCMINFKCVVTQTRAWNTYYSRVTLYGLQLLLIIFLLFAGIFGNEFIHLYRFYCVFIIKLLNLSHLEFEVDINGKFSPTKWYKKLVPLALLACPSYMSNELFLCCAVLDPLIYLLSTLDDIVGKRQDKKRAGVMPALHLHSAVIYTTIFRYILSILGSITYPHWAVSHYIVMTTISVVEKTPHWWKKSKATTKPTRPKRIVKQMKALD